MKFEWMNQFADPYYQTSEGRGIFLSGVVLGMVARGQVGAGAGIDESPMYKQVKFGRMKRQDLQLLLSRIPDLIRTYRIRHKDFLYQLYIKASENIIKDKEEIGIDGNFAFTLAFINASEYFWLIFPKETPAAGMDNPSNQVQIK